MDVDGEASLACECGCDRGENMTQVINISRSLWSIWELHGLSSSLPSLPWLHRTRKSSFRLRTKVYFICSGGAARWNCCFAPLWPLFSSWILSSICRTSSSMLTSRPISTTVWLPLPFRKGREFFTLPHSHTSSTIMTI